MYGKLPTVICQQIVDTEFWKKDFKTLYMPIKMAGNHEIQLCNFFSPFKSLIGTACCDFVGTKGLNSYMNSYLYMTAKRSYQKQGSLLNREGWHCDGFDSEDISYIWSDSVKAPTVFNTSPFVLSKDDQKSLIEMKEQALPENNILYPANTLLCLDEYVVHKPMQSLESELRTFLKLVFSKDKFDLEGNTHNGLFDYNWPMYPRSNFRNVPQSVKNKKC